MSTSWALASACCLLLSLCSTATATGYPSCPSNNPCPKTGTYYHCLSGKAVNGCQLKTPFPSQDCGKQCISKPPVTYPVCPYAVPCPMDATTYFNCQAGKAISGCRKVSDGPFPAADCSAQCTYNSANPKYIPPPCCGCTKANCPTDGQAYYFCKATGECRPEVLGWIPNCNLPNQQCLLPPAGNVCKTTTPCPKDSGAYWYCTAGKAVNGCQSVSKGPFPAADCTAQCKTA